MVFDPVRSSCVGPRQVNHQDLTAPTIGVHLSGSDQKKIIQYKMTRKASILTSQRIFISFNPELCGSTFFSLTLFLVM